MKYNYDVWGNTVSVINSQGVQVSETSSNISIIQPFRYRGYCFDKETGLYYLQSRYYDPVTHRFLNADDEDVVTSSQNALSDKNLFAYCDNNPICRADDEGDCWHILIGAAVGGVISGAISAISQYTTTGSIDWIVVGISTLSGAATGALACTGWGLGALVAANVGISVVENAASQLVENKGFKSFNVKDMLIDGAIGGATAAIGGKGLGNKHLNNLGKQTVKRTARETASNGFRSGMKEARKAFAYYGKNTAKYYKTFFKETIKDVAISSSTALGRRINFRTWLCR